MPVRRERLRTRILAGSACAISCSTYFCAWPSRRASWFAKVKVRQHGLAPAAALSALPLCTNKSCPHAGSDLGRLFRPAERVQRLVLPPRGCCVVRIVAATQSEEQHGPTPAATLSALPECTNKSCPCAGSDLGHVFWPVVGAPRRRQLVTLCLAISSRIMVAKVKV